MSSAAVVLAYARHTALLASASIAVVLAYFFCCKAFKTSVSPTYSCTKFGIGNESATKQLLIGCHGGRVRAEKEVGSVAGHKGTHFTPA